MKNRFVILALFALSALVFSCTNKDSFTLSGTITKPASVKTVYLLEADSTSIKIVDSASLNDGKFEFKRSTPYANLFKLRVGGAIFDLIAKNGESITFSTDMSDTKRAYQIAGSDESAKIQEYNNTINVYGEKNAKLNKEYQAKTEALGQETDSLVKAYAPLFRENSSGYSTAVLKFVDDNKKSLAAFYAISGLYYEDPYKYEPQMLAYADAIKGSFMDNPAVQRVVVQMDGIRPVSIGHKAPEFTIPGIDGKLLKLADLKGKYVMLDFWASWCGPCREENPNVVKLYAKYHPKGFNIVGISLDQKKEDWQEAINADKLTWQHGSELQRFDGATEKLYHIEAIPSNFIIDPQGIIVAKNIVGAQLEEFLNKTFSKPQ